MVVAQVLSLQELVQVRLHEILHNISAQVKVKESAAAATLLHAHVTKISQQDSGSTQEVKYNSGLEKYL